MVTKKMGQHMFNCDMPWYKDPGTRSAEERNLVFARLKGFGAWPGVGSQQGGTTAFKRVTHVELQNYPRRQASGLVSFTIWDTHSRENPLRSVGCWNLDAVVGNIAQHIVCRAMGLSPTITANKHQDPSCREAVCNLLVQALSMVYSCVSHGMKLPPFILLLSPNPKDSLQGRASRHLGSKAS